MLYAIPEHLIDLIDPESEELQLRSDIKIPEVYRKEFATWLEKRDKAL